MTSAWVVLSGGQDSTTCLYWAKNRFDAVHAITFDYGQSHIREIDAAETVAVKAGVNSWRVVEIPSILKGRSPLIDAGENLEQYEDFESMDETIGDRVELTFVPMRNALFLTIAANRAVCADVYDIVTGVCQSDNANYPDCRDSFIRHQTSAINYALGLEHKKQRVTIHTPLMNLTKAQSIDLACKLDGCYKALEDTHTSYDGQYPPTGKDHATVLRAHGFEEAGLPDPLIMRAAGDGLMEIPLTSNYSEEAIARFRGSRTHSLFSIDSQRGFDDRAD